MNSYTNGYSVHIFLIAVIMAIFCGDYLSDTYQTTHILSTLWYLVPCWIVVLLATGAVDYTMNVKTKEPNEGTATNRVLSSILAILMLGAASHLLNIFFFTLLNQVGRG